MAKQSALNTKSVQKLKDKAKVSAEKRLKQMRKKQLKAIKQVEKDEKYLIKLSNSRRPLRTAHSTSDIKLVGKRESRLIDFSPRVTERDRTDNRALLSYADLSMLQIDSNLEPDIGNSGFRYYGHYRSVVDHDSAYSSSSVSMSSKSNKTFSSTSGSHMALSSYKGTAGKCDKSNHLQSSKAQEAGKRPKFSDLVGLPSETRISVDIDETPATSTPIVHQSKTRGIGGATKNHLKRLWTQEPTETKRGQIKRLPTMQTSAGLQCHASVSDLSHREITERARETQSYETRVVEAPVSRDAKSIKWPPAPSVTRASSQPDLAHHELRDDNKTAEFQSDGFTQSKILDVADNEVLESHIANPSEPMNADIPKSRSKDSDVCDKSVRPETQHHVMLNKCLSQLKLHHEQIQKCSDTKPQSQREMASRSPQLSSVIFGLSCSSNELLQHRQNAGELPLKPSLIRQHQIAASKAARIPKLDAGKANQSRVDSIGSASSLAHRHSPPGNSEASSSSSPSSSLSCSWSNRTGSKTSSSVDNSADGKVQRHLMFNGGIPERYYGYGAEDEALEGFLCKYGLTDLMEVFAKEKIDLEALMLLSEEDLKSINIVLGPRRKLLKAIEKYRQSLPLTSPSVIVDTQL